MNAKIWPKFAHKSFKLVFVLPKTVCMILAWRSIFAGQPVIRDMFQLINQSNFIISNWRMHQFVNVKKLYFVGGWQWQSIKKINAGVNRNRLCTRWILASLWSFSFVYTMNVEIKQQQFTRLFMRRISKSTASTNSSRTHRVLYFLLDSCKTEKSTGLKMRWKIC